METNLEREAQIYANLMAEIKGRTLIVKDMINRLSDVQEQTHENLVQAECAVLQTRIITELIALSALTAHSPFGLTKDLLKSWNADKTFRMLEDVNPDCFPVALKPITAKVGNTHFDRLEGQITRQELAKIYERCGEMLHRGVLKHVLNGKRKILDLDIIAEAIERIIALLNCHAIVLLQQNTVLITFMGAPGEDIRVTVAEATIPAQ